MTTHLGPLRRVSTFVPPDLSERLTAAACNEGTTIAAYVRRVLIDHDRASLGACGCSSEIADAEGTR